MKSKIQTTLIVAAILSITSSFAFARPGGVYKGIASMNATTPSGGSPMTFNNVPVKIRLPNGKGKVTGTLFTTADSYPADVPISGRVYKATVRRGGLKHILRVRWSWMLDAAGFPGTASGKNKIIVKGSRSGYKIQPPAKVRVNGSGPDFKYTSKVRAKR